MNAERDATPLPQLTDEVATLASRNNPISRNALASGSYRATKKPGASARRLISANQRPISRYALASGFLQLQPQKPGASARRLMKRGATWK